MCSLCPYGFPLDFPGFYPYQKHAGSLTCYTYLTVAVYANVCTW